MGARSGTRHEAPEERVARLDRFTEIVAALILSVAALASSYAGFQAQLWDGDQAANYALAEQQRTASSRAAMIAAEERTLDILLFSQWLNAYADNDEKLQRFYRKRFRPQFEIALEEWLHTHPRSNADAPLSPLEMGSYARAADQETRHLERQADRLFAAGGRANDISDAYVQSTVILALCLFIGGVVQAFKSHWLRTTLLAVAVMALALGITRLVVLPALTLVL